MTNTDLMRRAVQLFPRLPYNTLSGVKYNRRAWLKSVADLGDKWILAKPIRRTT
jgi:hypothetical protein